MRTGKLDARHVPARRRVGDFATRGATSDDACEFLFRAATDAREAHAIGGAECTAVAQTLLAGAP